MSDLLDRLRALAKEWTDDSDRLRSSSAKMPMATFCDKCQHYRDPAGERLGVALALKDCAKQLQERLQPAQTPDRPMEWQPMETAPEDTPILMKMKHGVIQGTWDKKAGTGSGYYWTDITWFPQAWMPVPPFTRAQEGKA